MRLNPTLFTAAFLCLCAACATAPPKAPDPQRRAVTLRVLKQAMDLGRDPAVGGPAYTEALQEASLDWLLFRGGAPEAGARRLLDLRERHAQPALMGLFFDGLGAVDLAQTQQSESFRDGGFSTGYDPALFEPFFREALLDYLRSPGKDDAAMAAWLEPLELATKLTPRFGTYYPVQLSPDTRKAFLAYCQAHPGGQASERFAMFLALDDRCGAWAQGRLSDEARLRKLAADSHDELLKLEIADALALPWARPEKAFWMSLMLPGLGQASNGDLEGGLLLGGLTAAAWVWAGSRLAQAGQAPDDATRGVAYGDAALGAGLALLGHGFTALNAGEQARLVNVGLTWDALSKDRLKTEQR